MSRKEHDKAVADYGQAIQLEPTLVQAYLGRGVAYLQTGEYDKAIDDFDEVLRIDPGLAIAHDHRGAAWELKKEYEKAISDYSQAIKLDKQLASAYRNQARIWATSVNLPLRDSMRAVESATRACELTRWNRPEYLVTLAAASAASGDFESAANWQSKANALFTDEADRSTGESQLKAYRENIRRGSEGLRGQYK